MEYLEGVDASDLLARGPVPSSEAVDIVLEACEAVAEAHAAQIIHRDLKPSNLFLARRADGTRCVKVLDFGISKMTFEVGHFAVTKTHQLMGTPLYMSPEQLKNARTVDARTDVWSIGVILYELLAGLPPFASESLPGLCAVIINGELTPLPSVAPQVPAGLSAVVARCLKTDPGARFGDLAELAKALAPFGSGSARASCATIETALAGVARPAPVTSSGAWNMATAERPTTLERPRRSGWLVAGAGASLVVLFVGIGLVRASWVRREQARVVPPASVTVSAVASADPASAASSAASSPPSSADLAPPPSASAPAKAASKAPAKASRAGQAKTTTSGPAASATSAPTPASTDIATSAKD